jgi:uncharacterized membrane protein YbhN (UPF0104 family)
MKKRSTAIRLVSLAALVAVAAWYFRSQDLSALRAFRWSYAAPLIAVQLAALALNGWMNRRLIEQFGPKLSFVEWYGLAVVNALANYLPLPQAGAAVRGAYLKRLHGLGYRRYAATVLFFYVLTLVLIGVAGLASLAAITVRGNHVSWFLWLVFGGLASLAALLSPAAARLIPGKRLAEMAEGYRALGNWRLLRSIVFWKLVLIATTATGVWLAYHSIGKGRDTSWPGALLVSLSAMASGIVNVTPGNAGPAEAAAGASVWLSGGDPRLAVTVYLICGLSGAAVIFSLGPVFVSILGRNTPGQSAVNPSDPSAAPDSAALT